MFYIADNYSYLHILTIQLNFELISKYFNLKKKAKILNRIYFLFTIIYNEKFDII